jgi:cell division protein FtsW (lipid II flippase)
MAAYQRHRKRPGWYVTVPGVLAVSTGIALMARQEMNWRVWGVNAAGLLLGVIGFRLGIFIVSPRGKGAFFGALACLIPLLLPFLFSGQEGVYRWIRLGGFQLYIASIVVPLLIILLDFLLLRGGPRGVLLIAFLAIAVLGLQPDAAQLTAFAATMFFILFSRRETAAGWMLLLAALSSLIVWIWGDHLPAVAHVEGILAMAWQNGRAWGAVAVLSLLLLPLPFLGIGLYRQQALYTALGLYFVILIACGVFRNFPIPLLSGGFSPILGYFWALGILPTRPDFSRDFSRRQF